MDAPRDFFVHELFFSTTTPKGLVESGNDVFVRVSGYTADEMVGKPHNIIRHPDMPRSVFKLFWDHLLSHKPIAAYVKNMAKDGRYYWVVALAAETERGYLSVRFKPTSPLFTAIERIYREVLAAEKADQDQGGTLHTTLAAGSARLQELLKANGFADYDAFMRALLPTELKSRDQMLASQRRTVFTALPPRRSGEGALGAAVRAAHQESLLLYTQLDAMYATLDTAAQLNTQIADKAHAILDATGAFKLVALNIAIRSSRLENAGRALGVIAGSLGDASSGVARIVSALTTRAEAVSASLGDAVFNLGWTRLQFEMAIVYYQELLSHEVSDASHAKLDTLAALRFALCRTIERTSLALKNLAADLGGLSGDAESLRRAMLALQVVHIGGLIESRRLTGDDNFSAFFEDVREHIESTKTELDVFANVIHDLGSLARQAPRIVELVSKAANRMQHDERAMTAALKQPAVTASAA